MSSINTNGINVNYPVPGVNNNSQGFRDNFAAIKTNLDTAGTEITDLQNKVVLKAALDNSTLNNDMANTLISNALTKNFRASTYNLGNSISGTLVIDVSQADVQSGTIAGNTTLQLTNWAPANTQSNVQLLFSISNANAVISFPNSVANGNTVSTLENYVNIGGTATVTAPYSVTQLDYRLSSTDCGNTVVIEPFNRDRITAQVQTRTPPPTGYLGDITGTVAVDANYLYVCTGTFNSGGANTITTTATATYSSNNHVIVNSTTGMLANKPIVFAANIGGIIANQVYYINTVVGGTSLTVSATRTAGTAGANLVLTNGSGTIAVSSYNGTDIWKRVSLSTW